MMAIFDYNVTVDDVKEDLPFDPRRIPAGPVQGSLDDTDIEGYIDEGASELSGVLESSGVQGSDLSDEALQQIQIGVKHYAIRETLQSMGHTGDSYEQARDRYQEIYDRYAESDAPLDRGSSRVQSNVDTTADKKPAEFEGRYDF
jgi:hypothetical protein